MSNTRLEIGNNENCGYFTDIPVQLVYQISDVRQPDKRKGTRSFTINIPGSQENNILFENIFEANISLQTFNPHLKTSAKYYVDELIQFNGYAQLLAITKDEKTLEVRYEISLIGEINTLFTDIANLYLTDLDFSAYDHDLTYAEISGSWGASGSGFVYPHIDWGTNNSNLSVWRPKDFRACYFVREYLDKIFTDAGYSWDSTFLDSTFFSKLIIPSTRPPQLTTSTVNDNKFLAVADGTEVITKAATNNQSNLTGFVYTNLDNINFQTETYDTGNIFSTPNFTVPNTSKYNLKAAISLGFVAKRNAVDVTANVSVFTTTGVHVIIYNVTNSTIAGVYDLNLFANNVVGSLNNTTYQCHVNLTEVPLVANDVYKVAIKIAAVNLSHSLGTGTWTLETTIKSGSYFTAELSSNQIFEGALVPGDSLVPEGIKQTDFIASLIRMFNLYFMIDPTNPRKYLIEPREDFYSTTAVDWTQKHDDNSVTRILPLGQLDAKDYRASYKQDGDFFNKLYYDGHKNQDSSQQVYGTHEESITNDFLKNQNQINVIFAATPYASNSTSTMVVPTIIKKENGNVSEINHIIRVLYYSGSLTPVGLSWTFKYNNDASSVLYNSQLHAGHTDTPYAPTLDLNWGLPVETYYTYPNLYWTNNNLWNKYYSVDFQRMTDKNSRIVITDFYLTAEDIHKFDFRKPIFWKDAYYLVNNLNYNPLERVVTTVELLKLTRFDAFTPTTYAVNAGPNNDTKSWEKIKGDDISNGPSNNSVGDYNFISGGENNFIANSSSNVALINCENCSAIGVENFTAINASNMVFDSTYSNTTYNGADEPITISSDTDIDRSYNGKTLLVDCSGGDVTLTFDPYNMNYATVIVIRTDNSANLLYIDSTSTYGTENIIGNAFPYDTGMVQYDSAPLKVVSDTIYIAN